MKMPNGYGSVVKLSGARRKPWAVRVSYLEEQDNGTVKRKQKYLAYFAEQKHALTYLAEYNNGAVVKEHQKYTDVPTFAEMFDKWEKYRRSLKSAPSESTWKNYKMLFPCLLLFITNAFRPSVHRNCRTVSLHKVLSLGLLSAICELCSVVCGSMLSPMSTQKRISLSILFLTLRNPEFRFTHSLYG